MKNQFYILPDLPFKYDALAPFISEEQLKIHHQKHHNSYVLGANSILEKFDTARQEKKELDYKAELKALSFHIGGHILHSLFWKNLTPPNKENTKISKEMVSEIERNFGAFERFKNEFSAVALSVEGSGWAALVHYPETNRLMCVPIEKHNVLLTPATHILLVIDVFEHAYYLDYRNERAKFIEAFWNIIHWEEVYKRWQKNK